VIDQHVQLVGEDVPGETNAPLEVLEPAFSFLSASGRFAIAQGWTATLVQVTGGSARRALPGRGLWAAGSFGVRAITNAAALELRPRGIQVASADAARSALDRPI
jgi:hypothetical protein